MTSHLTSEDLTKCQLIWEGYCRRNDVQLWSSEGPLIRAIIIEIYQHAKRLRFPLDEEGSGFDSADPKIHFCVLEADVVGHTAKPTKSPQLVPAQEDPGPFRNEEKMMTRALREARFEETTKVAKELIEAAAKAKKEKSERLRNERLAAQSSAARSPTVKKRKLVFTPARGA